MYCAGWVGSASQRPQLAASDDDYREPAGGCGHDIGGWSVPTVDLRSDQQLQSAGQTPTELHQDRHRHAQGN